MTLRMLETHLLQTDDRTVFLLCSNSITLTSSGFVKQNFLWKKSTTNLSIELVHYGRRTCCEACPLGVLYRLLSHSTATITQSTSSTIHEFC